MVRLCGNVFEKAKVRASFSDIFFTITLCGSCEVGVYDEGEQK